MRLRDWLNSQPARTQTELSHTRKVSYATLCRAKRGERVSKRMADVISELTGGAVTIVELRPPAKRKAAKKRAAKTSKPSKRRTASKSSRRAA